MSVSSEGCHPVHRAIVSETVVARVGNSSDAGRGFRKPHRCRVIAEKCCTCVGATDIGGGSGGGKADRANVVTVVRSVRVGFIHGAVCRFRYARTFFAAGRYVL